MKLKDLIELKSAININGLLLFFSLFIALFSDGQTVPDGTEGEVIDTTNFKNKTPHLRFVNWNYFDGPLTTLRLGGGFLYDYVTYIQDDASKEQIKCTPEFKVRDARIVLAGQFKFKREISWKAGYMYDGTSNQWLMRESGVMISVPEISGLFFIGRSKEGFSMNKIMNGYAGWSMERQMGIDVIPILADGIKYLGYFPKKRIIFNFGTFADWFSKNQSFSTFKWQVVSRIGWLPIYSLSQKKVLHIGLNTRYGKPKNGIMRLRSRPESNPSPYFVDTDTFASIESFHIGGELYYSSGPWMFGGEYYAHKFMSSLANNPTFFGGEIMGSWIITGESRPYNTNIGVYGFVPVKKSVFKGGPGAWEVMTRVTNIDLNGGNLTGGKFWKMTAMVNWYLSSNVRFEFVYGYGLLNRFDKTGGTNFFQSRIQFML